MDQRIAVTVRCYAGYKGDERPTSFDLEGRTVQIVDILDRWYETDANCFKVLDDNGTTFLLRHDLNTNCWDLLQ